MDGKLCSEKRKRIDERIDRNEARLNRLSERIDIAEGHIIAQQKDTTHLYEAIRSLKDSIDILIQQIGELKYKPLEKYEKIGMVIITAIISYLAGKLL